MTHRMKYNKNKRSHRDSESKIMNGKIEENLREDQVGITEYISSLDGFFGILKSRFSDFQVNEIDLDGNIVELNDLTTTKVKTAIIGIDALNSDDDKKKFDGIIKAEIWQQVDDLAKQKLSAESIRIDATTLDKAQRTEIHQLIKKLYENKLVSSTADEKTEGSSEAKKFIIIKKPLGRPDESRKEWKSCGEFVHFVVYKENMGTIDLAGILAKRLNGNPSQITYCGTKDKRAITTQKFCIKKREPEKIVSAVKSIRNVHIGNFEFKNYHLKLGSLKGNRFRIVLRHLKDEKDVIEKALEHVKEHGFINYFGLQRFGNCAAIPTYEIGVALLKADYKKACELILKPRENDAPYMKEIREEWWETRDSKAASRKLRNNGFIEKKLLDGLANCSANDFATALRKVPRNMLSLYSHAYQSLVFNKIASRRIKEFGIQLIVGDLVYRNKSELDELDTTFDTDVEVDNDANDNDDDDKAVKESINDGCADAKSEEHKKEVAAKESSFKLKVKAVTQEDIESGEYNIFDVVLPLPGHDITYPSNAVHQWYIDILKEHNLEISDFRKNVKVYNMMGAYRKLVIQPQNMSWKFCDYERSDEDLIKSDWEVLQNRKNENKTAESNGKETSENNANSCIGQFRALALDVCLPSSCYATMFLRELLKIDTSASNQANLERERLSSVKEQMTTKRIRDESNEKTEAFTKCEGSSANADSDSVVQPTEVKKQKLNSQDDLIV